MNIDLQAIKKIIAQGESDTLEFKKSTTQLEAIAETLSAFANGYRPRIYFRGKAAAV